ncbi:hypothetical protein MPLB_140033 [Mesorhizobium sp. ORS 3324]|nr:hypothetical protein MPLB_140033 [Mesorhizobium sp. ORS 3324]
MRATIRNSSERGLKTQPTMEKMAESVGKRHRDDGIMTFVLGAMRKGSVALGGSHLWCVVDPLQVSCANVGVKLLPSFLELLVFSVAIPVGKPLRTFPGIALDLQRFQQADRRHHVALAGRAARHGLGILAPMLDLPVLVDMAGGPGFFAVELTEIDGERKQRGPGQRGHDVDGSQPHRLGALGKMGAKDGDRLARLLDMDDALGKVEARAEAAPRPIEDRIPELVLAIDQPLRAVGAIAEQVRRSEAQHILQHRLRVAGDAVDGRVGKTHDRHGHRVDDLALRGELVGHQLRRSFCRKHQQRLARGADRPAVEMNGKTAFGRHDRDSLVEALRQRRLHLDLSAAHRIGIGKLLSGLEVIEDVAHVELLTPESACAPAG